MAHIQSAVSDLFEAFRSGEGVDLVRESVRIVLQELIESEASAVIGADRYERTPERVTERNGVRWRELMTRLAPSRSASRNCGRVRSSPQCWNHAAASTRPSTRSSWRRG